VRNRLAELFYSVFSRRSFKNMLKTYLRKLFPKAQKCSHSGNLQRDPHTWLRFYTERKCIRLCLKIGNWKFVSTGYALMMGLFVLFVKYLLNLYEFLDTKRTLKRTHCLEHNIPTKKS